MLRRYTFLAGLLLGLTCTIQATSPQKTRPRDFAASPNPHVRLFAYILQKAVWPTPRVYVCWENLTAAHAADATRVQQAITGSWQKESALQFIGWQACTPKSAGIRIHIEDVKNDGPHTLGLGQALAGKPKGMTLNFTFQNWSQSCATDREYCIKAIAVHEFGHAIGFAHEQNRPDPPMECQLLKQGTDGDRMLTTYDEHSVMNYCNQKYNNNGDLSLLDKQAVREVYGAPKPAPAN